MKQINDLFSFEAILKEEDIVLALLSDLKCNVCLAIYPDLLAMAEHYPKAKFVSMDVQAMKALVGQYMVFVYPTVILFVQGKESVRFERVFSMDDIEERLNRYYGMIYD